MQQRLFKSIISMLLSALVCIHSLPIAFAGLPEGIEVSLFKTAKQTSITVRYKNIGDLPITILMRGTALEEVILEDFLSVSFNGVSLDYEGPILRRVPPLAREYKTIAPGKHIDATVDVSEAYNLTAQGTYSIFYKGERSLTASKQQTLLIEVTQTSSRPKQPPAYESCNSTEQARANSALSVAESYMNRSRADIAATPLELRGKARRYREWFGVYEVNRWNTVQRNVNRVASAINNKQVTFNCLCDDSRIDRGTVVAYVFKSRHYNINLCPIFWKFRGSGVNSKAGVLVHEMSHFNVTASTNDHAYGQSNSRNLANTSPSQAISNASSYEYFAENPRNLSMPTQADLDNGGGSDGGGSDGGGSDGGGSDGGGSDGGTLDPGGQPTETSLVGVITSMLFKDDKQPVLPELPADFPVLPEQKYSGGVMVIQKGNEDATAFGETELFDLNNSVFNIRKYNNRVDGLQIHVHSGRSMNLIITKPTADSLPFSVGAYSNTSGRRFVSGSDVVQGLRFNEGRTFCGAASGEFTVRDVAIDQDGKYSRLAISFTQICEEEEEYGSIRGQLYFDESLPAPPHSQEIFPTGTPYPPLLNFKGSEIGIELRIEGQEGDYISGGNDYLFNSVNSEISIVRNSHTGLSLRASEPLSSWSLHLSSVAYHELDTPRLTPGIYLTKSFDNTNLPRAHFSGDGRGCTQRGHFRVFDVDFDKQEKLVRLVADFEQYCASSDYSVKGSLYMQR